MTYQHAIPLRVSSLNSTLDIHQSLDLTQLLNSISPAAPRKKVIFSRMTHQLGKSLLLPAQESCWSIPLQKEIFILDMTFTSSGISSLEIGTGLYF